jgi:hypothetical protein
VRKAEAAVRARGAGDLESGLLAAIARASSAYERRSRFVHDLHGVSSTADEKRLVRMERTANADPVLVDEDVGAIGLAATECWFAAEGLRHLRDRAASL